jgi:hypothetical protein
MRRAIWRRIGSVSAGRPSGWRRATTDGDAPKQQTRDKLVLEKRDQFIAGRIHGTLKVDEIGLIFLGLLHAVEAFLWPDIELTRKAWWAATDE